MVGAPLRLAGIEPCFRGRPLLRRMRQLMRDIVNGGLRAECHAAVVRHRALAVGVASPDRNAADVGSRDTRDART